MKKGIIVVCPYLLEGHKKFATLETIQKLAQRGYKIIALSSHIFDSRNYQKLGKIEIFRVRSFFLRSIPYVLVDFISLFKKIKQITAKNKIHIAHIYTTTFPISFFSVIYFKFLHIPVVVTELSGYVTTGCGKLLDFFLKVYFYTFLRLIYKWADIVLAISKGQIPFILRLNTPYNKIRVLPNVGLSDKFFKYRERNKARKMLGLSDDSFVIGFVGRLKPSKGIYLLINATRNLRTIIPKIRLLIVGPSETLSINKLKEETRDLGNIITFLGYRRDIEKILPAFDVFVLPSFSEGLGMAVLEAMASGIPVITTKTPGTQGFIRNGWNGILIPIGDIESLEENILLLYRNSQLRQFLSDNGKKTANEYRWSKILPKLENIYNELSKKRT